MKKLKSFGQHFLRDENVAKDIVDALILDESNPHKVIEIGPGEGVLTKYLLELEGVELTVIEIDKRLPDKLIAKFPSLDGKIVNKDVLKVDFEELSNLPISVIGNFPYNISSQILFKIIDHRDLVWQMVGMFQKEVAKRVASKPGSRVYGVVSVLVQAFYDVSYIIEVPPHFFAPPPKVHSAVIRLERHHRYDKKIDKSAFFRVVKMAFSQRRKKLRNALKGLGIDEEKLPDGMLDQRAEQLNVDDFILLMNQLTK